MFKTGTYKALIKGVSQQTPQEREDGQLSTQVNMVSDIVNGLRRRGGFKAQAILDVDPSSFFNVIQLAGEYYVQSVSKNGTLSVFKLNDGSLVHRSILPYLVHTNKSSIRTTTTRNQCFILNTDKVPIKVLDPTTSNPIVPISNEGLGWIYLTGGSSTNWQSGGINATLVHPILGSRTYIARGEAARFVPYTEMVVRLYNNMLADAVLLSNFNVELTGTTIAISSKVVGSGTLVVTGALSNPDPNINTLTFRVSGSTHTVAIRADLPPTLTNNFDKYVVHVLSVPYMYFASRGVWEVYNPAGDVLNPKSAGWIRIQSGAFSKQYSITITQGSKPIVTYSVTTDASIAANATSEYVATQLQTQMIADSVFTSNGYSVDRVGSTLAILSTSESNQLVITASGGETYIIASNASNTTNKGLLPPTLSSALDGYIQSVGTGDNLAYYKYNHETRTWTEVGEFESSYTIQNVPVFWYFDYDVNLAIVEALNIKGRAAGNDLNNPVPKFIDYGLTGIGSYQSRLVLLSGSYVYLSKSTDPTVFMRTTVTELLDTDPIEVSATSLSNAQFEYAVPFNKDLILVAQNQQAVIPNNSTVLTPKTAAIYPTTTTDISLACEPTVIARSLYYVYQRTTEFYQVGEFLPSPYTDSQYTTQSTTDHLPLYAEDVCTSMSGSTASNIACFSSDSPEVLVNQYYWAGDERPLMCYHKWVLPRNVMYNTQVGSTTVFLVADGDKTLVVSTDIQLNQLGTKPVPFLDLYQYIEIDSTGVGIKPEYLPEGDLVAVIYDSLNQRHSEVAFTVDGDTILCKYTGTIAIGLRYPSEFTITPPFLRDANGNVVAGSKTTIHSLNFTLRSTGKYKYTVLDTYGYVADTDSSGVMWSEVDLGYTWIGSVVNSVVPCRTRLNSTEVVLSTQSTTDLNVTTVEFSLRVPDRDIKRRR